MDAVPLKFIDSVVELFDSTRTLTPVTLAVQQLLRTCSLSLFSPSTMDAVPLKFVDSVVEFFDSDGTLTPVSEKLAGSRSSLWKKVIDVHQQNRKVYNVFVRVTKDGTKFAVKLGGSKICYDLATIRKNRRFARISDITDDFDDEVGPSAEEWKGVKPLNRREAVKQLERVASQLEPSSWLYSYKIDEQKIILSSLLNVVTLGRIHLAYHGQTFFKHWKRNGSLNFHLCFTQAAVDPEARRALSNHQVVGDIEKMKSVAYLKHETERSFSVFYSFKSNEPEHPIYCCLNFYPCTCHMSHGCLFKENFPTLHNL
uniref:F-box domain-containing protein n=1 Tax=Steinernema glaseri TaxID=37863 RepID=A0A1I7XWI0_9BILA